MAKIVLTLPKSLQKPPEASVGKPMRSKGLPVPSKAAAAPPSRPRGRPLGSTKASKMPPASPAVETADAPGTNGVVAGNAPADFEALRDEIDKQIAARINNPPPLKMPRAARFRNRVRSNEFLPLVERYATLPTLRAIHFLESMEQRSVEVERPDPFQTFPISLMESKALNDAIRIMYVKHELEKRSIEEQKSAADNGKRS